MRNQSRVKGHLKFFPRRVAGNGEQLNRPKKRKKRMKIKVYVAGVARKRFGFAAAVMSGK
jgi:hypothetical protein